MGNQNCTLSPVPSTKEYLSDISDQPVFLTALVICTVIAALQVVLLIESACFLDSKVRPSTVSNHRITTWWMIAVLPVMSCVVLPGIYSPISATFCNLIASLCYSFTIFKFLVLLVNYYGGYTMMVIRFSAERVSFSLASAPLTCCCPCLPEKRLTRRSFKWLKIAVLQVAILKPVVTFIGVLVWLNGVYLTEKVDDDTPFLIANIANIFSSVVAMTSLNMLYTASTDHLGSYNIGVKFTFIKLGIVICNIQPALLNLFMSFRVLDCAFPYTNTVRANVAQCVLLILEAGVLFPFVRYYYRRTQGNVIGNVSQIPSAFLDVPGISPRLVQLVPRPSIDSTTDGRRPRVWTVIGSGDVSTDFTSNIYTIPEEGIKDESNVTEITRPSFSEGFAHGITPERRYTIS